jgi:hypothetical protein
MLRRHSLLIILLVGVMGLVGCHACSSCYDYSPPVANCDCCACGTHRAGSVWGGGCHTGGCSTCNTAHTDSGYSQSNRETPEGTQKSYNQQPGRATANQQDETQNEERPSYLFQGGSR